ncbi:phosphoglycerate kinase [Streptomyces roseoverticillatus]|uniref:phosphoglycerate kinase n=1 Tax=Streptomyces roseoverticillatus TaxID=66429 RepID=UPI001FE1CA04|nr:phosphoglycerate kinase [Streptomyces roseoverticillatus]
MRLLSEHTVLPGERWVYSAGCNAGPALTDTGRIDTELDDLRRLAAAGARVALLSHQGSAKDGTARHLEYLADYLGKRLGQKVRYFPECATDPARRRAAELRDGDIVLFGNVRLDAREEDGDRELAAALARLGDRVAIGGFSKAHRRHASNVGILGFLPGYAAASLVRETELLRPWRAGSGAAAGSVAVLGGVKPEKTTVGLESLTRTYDLVIPGGAVLNTILAVIGYAVGDSELGADPERCAAVTRAVLARSNRARIHLPRTVVIAGPAGATRAVPVENGVPDGWAVVDFHLEQWAVDAVRQAGRVLVAGTPGRHTEGNHRAAAAVLGARAPGDPATLLLGGDTVAELPWAGPRSTGGGSALHYLADGTCAVIEALDGNRHKESSEHAA